MSTLTMKIYTKTGDKGETGLFTGKRVPKNSPYIEGYGNVDELNSSIGLALSFIKDLEILEILKAIQKQLFRVGADLATAYDNKKSKAAKYIERTSESDIQKLEKIIDRLEEKLPKLKNFVLPAGSRGAATLHLSRTICRRAERSVTTLLQAKKANPQVLMYLNRLSDLLFVLARYTNLCEGQTEEIWEP